MNSGIYLKWKDISAQVNGKQILHNISGYCKPSSTLAIMGPSGAGKTTLLSILAQKYGKSLIISGNVLANNTIYSEKQFYNFASFVYQNDLLNEALTVRQTIQFTAKLKLEDPSKVSQRVDQLIRDFSLQKCANTYVGGKFIKGISGGEKKRVCIAVQMVNKPDLLILDEPTSGLDSYMANSIIKIFNKLAKKEGRTIIFTIHQPSYKIFTQLDRLLLLDKGQCIYQGLAAGITEYLMSLHISIPTNTTICDFFMFQISDYQYKVKNAKTKLNSIAYNQKLTKIIENQIKQVKQQSPDGYTLAKVARNFLQQFTILMERQLKLFTRNPMKMGRSIGNSILMIIIIGLIFLNSISDNRPSTQDGKKYLFEQLNGYFLGAQGTSFIIVTSVIMTGIFSVTLVFPTERQVYTKQSASKTYSTLPYFLSKLIVEFFTLVISILIFAAGCYWFLGYNSNFFYFLKFAVILSSVSFVGNSIGFWTGSLFKDAQRSSAMAPALLLPLMTFSGLYNKLDSIPKWISWMQYISPFRYGLHAVLLNQYNDEKYETYDRGVFDYRQDLSINLDYWENIVILLGLSALYYSLAFIFLKKLSTKMSA